MNEVFGIQPELFILLTFIVGIIIGCVLTVRHYKHRDALREAEEYGRNKEITRLPPPTDYERFLRHLTAICNNTHVESYDIKAYGYTFTCLSPKDQ